MESGQQKHYELRSRSRSRSETPQMLSRAVTENEDSEHHYELRSRSRDRSMTPGEVSSSRRSTSRSLPSSVVKARNKNMDTIIEQKDDTLTDNNSETQSKSSDKSLTVTKSTKKTERRSERQRIKRQIFANGQSEIKDDSSDTKSETKERKRESLTPKRIMTSDYSSEEGDREDVPSRPGSAYEFYKQQGEYWNKFPKTDYTYSQTSTCRYEVAPGVMAIPNMSRRSLHSDGSFVDGSQASNSQSLSQSSKESFNEESNAMDLNEIRRDLSDMVPQLLPHIRGSDTAGQSVVYKRTHVEQYNTRRELIYETPNDNQINEKYESWANPLRNSQTINRYRSTAYVDSDTEFDDIVAASNHRYQLKHTQRFSRFTSLISTWFYTILHFVTFGQFKKRKFNTTSHYYRRYEETKWSRLRQQIDTVMQHMYFLLVKVVLLDSWLLSRASNIRERVHGRRTKILWLVLLPLVLTIGCWFLPHILSAIPLPFKQMLPQIKEDIPITDNIQKDYIQENYIQENYIQENYVQENYVQEDLKSDKELKNVIDLLISRVQHLETEKAKHSEHLSSVTQVLEQLKRNDSNIWKRYDEKLLSLEQEMKTYISNRESCKAEEIDFIRVEFQTLKRLYTQLKTCCDSTSQTVNEEEIQKQADKVFAGYFGDSFSKQDVIRLFQIMNSKIQQDELEKSSKTSSSEPAESSALGVDEIRKIVSGILKIYDADKTGRVDYALESAGGQVISTRCTQRYNIHTRAFKILGLTLYYESNNPRTVIQGNTLQPGMCWAFQDFPGYLLIKLRSLIFVTGFTVEHAPRSNLPNGEMKSAPRKFTVWGLKAENDLEPVMFGEYEFLDSDESLQYFAVQNTLITTPYEYVEMRIDSNHGQLEYTCLYRFRVHGNLA